MLPFVLKRPLGWPDVYREADFYKAVVRVYTKPLFYWRKATSSSTDGKTLYDLAGRGLRGLDAIHQSLRRQDYQFRPAVALRYNFNGKKRTLYISPWEERIVDLLLYRRLNRKLDGWFSSRSYAYRDRSYGLDLCQRRIAAALRSAAGPLYIVKRDITEYFASVDHEILLGKLASLVDREDYLFRLLEQRVRFRYCDEAGETRARVGIPFGAAIACFFANVYLTGMDREIEQIPDVAYFRYADDILAVSRRRDAATRAAEQLRRALEGLQLRAKESHNADLVLAADAIADAPFQHVRDFRHLGLLFRAPGDVALSRDKCRKIRNLFRFAFRRRRRLWKKEPLPEARAQVLVSVAGETIEKGVRNVAILDYYLRHVSDEEQLRRLDQWLAEEVLSLVFGGHRKSHFRRISFRQLRRWGLPSLVHRRRLIHGGRIESPFFIWQAQKATRAFRGTVARRRAGLVSSAAFSPLPEATARKSP